MKRERKIKFSRLAFLLFFKRHVYPGAREWELEKYLGRDYEELIKEFNDYLSPLDLSIKKVEVEENNRKATYYIVQPKGYLSISEVKTFGWRIDEMAILTVALAHILADNGKSPRKEIENILKEKFPEWRVIRLLDKFIKLKYLDEEDEYLKIGLRTRLEVDLSRLTSLLIGQSISQEPETVSKDSSSHTQEESE